MKARRVGGWTVAVAAACAAGATAAAAAGTAVLADDFADGRVNADLWSIFATNPAVTTVVEQNGRLEFPTAGNPVSGTIAVAGAVGEGWALDWSGDFALSIDLRGAVGPLAPGGAMAQFALAFDSDADSGVLVDGINVFAGSYFSGFVSLSPPFTGYEIVRAGVVQNLVSLSTSTTVTAYLEHTAAPDTLSISLVGFGDPGAIVVANLGDLFASDLVTIMLRGGTKGPVGAIPGDALHVDDLLIEAGAVVLTDCPADLNGDTIVGFVDLSEMLNSWGPCPGCEEDLTGNDHVNGADLAILLAGWGACG